MKTAPFLILFPALCCAQDLLTRGADVFNKTCATGYCHALKGASGGGAPRLAARGFDDAYISQVVRMGIPGTAMPAFGSVLSRPDLVAVIAYVDSLNGVTPPANPAFMTGPASKKLTAEGAKGRALFFDQTRGFNRCSTCHQVEGFGIPVAAPIVKVPETVAALRDLTTPEIDTATTRDESFPALVIGKGVQTKVYDLTSLPPVLRTIPKADITLKEGSTWNHSSALNGYSDQELEAILAYLREAITT